MASLVEKLGYKTKHGQNYVTVQKRLNDFGISTEHFKTWVRPQKRVYTDDDVFCKNSGVGQNTLRRFYLRREDIPYQCVLCGTADTWNGKPIVLQLDHIDGNSTNNLLNNLRWLCPNCHSQTKTFAGRNVKKQREEKKNYCIDCGKEISLGALRCIRCLGVSRRKIGEISREELVDIIQTHKGNFAAVGRVYGVAGNTIKKWCRRHDMSDCPNDYRIHKTRKPLVKHRVDQIDPQTKEVVASFDSIKSAEKVTGIFHIREASDPDKPRQTAGGYIWIRKPS